jgi:hypothetical protein
MAAERAPASFDHRHRFVGNFTYELPRSWLGAGWRVNGVVNLQSGAPFTINLGTDRANVGSGQQPVGGPRDGGEASGGRVRKRRPNGSTSIAWRCPPRSRLATRGETRDRSRLSSVDVALQKDLILGNGRSLELRWEVLTLSMPSIRRRIGSRSRRISGDIHAQPARQCNWRRLLF